MRKKYRRKRIMIKQQGIDLFGIPYMNLVISAENGRGDFIYWEWELFFNYDIPDRVKEKKKQRLIKNWRRMK